MTRLAIACVSCAWVLACGTAEARRDTGADGLDSATAALIGEDKPNAGTSQPSAAAGDDSLLRRSYFADDMKLHPCITRTDDARIIGKSCPSAFVVFGPYVTVPSNSEVQLRFDIQAGAKLNLASDIISNGAKQLHGALDEQNLSPGELRSVGYRIRVFDATRTLETRIGIRASGPADFEIKNLEVKVQ